MKDEGIVTMVCAGGLFIAGKLFGKTMLKDPRVFAIIDEGKKIQLSPLPGTPGMITLGEFTFMYEIPKEDRNLQELYYRVTHPQPDNEDDHRPGYCGKLVKESVIE